MKMKSRARLKRAATYQATKYVRKKTPPPKRDKAQRPNAQMQYLGPFGLGPERVGRWARTHSLISSCARCCRRGGQLNMPVTFDTRSSWGFGVLRSLRRFFWRGLTARPLGAQRSAAQRSDGLDRLSLAWLHCILPFMAAQGEAQAQAAPIILHLSSIITHSLQKLRNCNPP